RRTSWTRSERTGNIDGGGVFTAAARRAPGGGRNRTDSAAAVGSLATDRGPEPLTGCFVALASTGPRAALLHDIDFLSRYRLSLLVASSACRARPKDDSGSTSDVCNRGTCSTSWPCCGTPIAAEEGDDPCGRQRHRA